MEATIRSAIISGISIRFTYKGQFYCLVEPLGYGIDARGKGILRGRQVAGSSEEGSVLGLKYFEIDRISNLEKMGCRFKAERSEKTIADDKIEWICCNNCAV